MTWVSLTVITLPLSSVAWYTVPSGPDKLVADVGAGGAEVAGAVKRGAGVFALVTEGVLVTTMTTIRATTSPNPDAIAVRILWRLGHALRGGNGGGWGGGG